MSKQIIRSKGNIFEKVVRDKNGKLILAKFFVYENAGRIKVRLVDFVYITTEEIAGKVSSLIGIAKNSLDSAKKFFEFSLEPITYNLITIFSIGSKPRAPTI